MNELSARKYFERTGLVFVMDKIIVNYTTTVRIQQYENFDKALRYVRHTPNAVFINLTAARRYGWEDKPVY